MSNKIMPDSQIVKIACFYQA